MPGSQIRFERLELKFLIDEIEAKTICAQAATYCKSDKHNTRELHGRSDLRGYEIRSLYLDSPRLEFHRAKERGDPNRIKLRIRSYSQTSPAILEIKKRHSQIIAKTRTVIAQSDVERAVSGMLPINKIAADQKAHYQDFVYHVSRFGALPTLTVRYNREAYESLVDPYARVTFDRDIQARHSTSWDISDPASDWHSFDDHWQTGHRTTPVVLELKCQTRIPLWMIDLIRENQLKATSFSKYSIGIGLAHLDHGRFSESSRARGSLR